MPERRSGRRFDETASYTGRVRTWFILDERMPVRYHLGFLIVLAAHAQDVTVIRDVKVPMRDGIRLATDIYLPSGNGRYPTLVYRTPYDRRGQKGESEFFARNGYAVVAQDVRGRFGSEGVFYPFLNEGPDGHDTIEWAAAQPWSNGKVGTNGASYLAWDQYAAAMHRPPHLVAMFANVGGANFHGEFGHPGGTPNLGWPLWIVRSAETSPPAQSLPEAKSVLTRILQNPGDWYAKHPKERGAVFDPFPVHKRIYDDFYAHSVFDDYWKQGAFFIPSGWKQMMDVPVLFISGWYDYFGDGLIGNFQGLSKQQRSPQRLVMGPWPHGIGGEACGDGYFGQGAAMNIRELALDWFDHWMKGSPLRRVQAEPVRYFRMGGGPGGTDSKGRRQHGGEWRTASAWPPPQARPRRLYAAGGKRLTERPERSEPQVILFDPERPVPTIGGRYGSGSWTPNCFQNQVCRPGVLGCSDSRPLAERDDVLVFQTLPLESDLEVSGEVRIRLWISSDSPDTDFTAKLIDVYPDGYAAHISDGQIRARYRKGPEREVMLTPGKVESVDIRLGNTSNLFARGHRIRLDVSSSNWPRFEANPNTGEAAGKWTSRRVARNTLHLDRASYLELPVMSAPAFEAPAGQR